MSRRKSNFDGSLLVILLFVSSILLWTSTGEFVVSFRDVGFSVASSFEKVVFSVHSFFKNTVTSIMELSSLKEKYNELTEKLNKYEILENSTQALKKENKELRELLGLSNRIRTHNIVAEIIGLDPNNLYYGIIINRGLKHGIKKNMPVIAFEKGGLSLVGKIMSVGAFSSVILPLYDDRCFIAAKMEESRHRGIVAGQGSASLPLIMRYVKKRVKDEVKVGDVVLTSGLDDSSIFPKNIPIGYISKIAVHDYETSLELFVEPMINFSTLEYVFVLDVARYKGDDAQEETLENIESSDIYE